MDGLIYSRTFKYKDSADHFLPVFEAVFQAAEDWDDVEDEEEESPAYATLVVRLQVDSENPGLPSQEKAAYELLSAFLGNMKAEVDRTLQERYP